MQNQKMSERAQPKGGDAFPRSWWAGWLKRPRRGRTVSLEQRLKAGLVLDPDTGCLLWAGAKTRGGYGNLKVKTHRVAWELANGPIPEGAHVLHRCDNPRCCNPDHLYLGAQPENMADMVGKGRARNKYTGKITAPRRPLRPRVRSADGRFL